MRNQKSKSVLYTTLSLGLVAAINSVPASAVTLAVESSNFTITPVFDSSITSLSNASDVMSAINTQIKVFETYLTTSAPVNLKIKFINASSGLGSSVDPTIDVDYTTYRNYLLALPNQSSAQVTAFNSLPTGANTGLNNATQVAVTAAQAAVIGDTGDSDYLLGKHSGIAAEVSLNISRTNVLRTNIDPNLYDLQALAAHEITEALGAGGWGSTLDSAYPLPTDVGSLDLYRFSAPGVRSFRSCLDKNII